MLTAPPKHLPIEFHRTSFLLSSPLKPGCFLLNLVAVSWISLFSFLRVVLAALLRVSPFSPVRSQNMSPDRSPCPTHQRYLAITACVEHKPSGLHFFAWLEFSETEVCAVRLALEKLIDPGGPEPRSTVSLSVPTYRSLCLRIALCANLHSLCLRVAPCAYVSLSMPAYRSIVL